jgi:CheY-like chemotaxis protein
MQHKRILIVDDKEETLYLLRTLLGHNGYTLAEARNGAEALAEARRHPPDLIVTDIFMPVMDGFTLCRECKKDAALQKIPVVFYSATYTDERDRDFALSLGAARFIVKPEEPEVFMRTLREVIREHPAADPEPVVSEEEEAYLRKHNATLIRKLEERSERLERANEALRRQLDELRRWYTATLGRELRVLELKHEVNELLRAQGLPVRYESVDSPPESAPNPPPP